MLWETLVNKTTFLIASSAMLPVPPVGSAFRGLMHPYLVSGNERCPAPPCCLPAGKQGDDRTGGCLSGDLRMKKRSGGTVCGAR